MTREVRRPEIDVLNVIMTWFVLSYHVTVLYMPNWKFTRDNWIDNLPQNFAGILLFHPWDLCLYTYFTFMYAWNMPFFFFLGGINSFLSLSR